MTAETKTWKQVIEENFKKSGNDNDSPGAHLADEGWENRRMNIEEHVNLVFADAEEEGRDTKTEFGFGVAPAPDGDTVIGYVTYSERYSDTGERIPYQNIVSDLTEAVDHVLSEYAPVAGGEAERVSIAAVRDLDWSTDPFTVSFDVTEDGKIASTPATAILPGSASYCTVVQHGKAKEIADLIILGGGNFDAHLRLEGAFEGI